MKLKFTKPEIIDLAKAWIAISIAFAIISTRNLTNQYGQVDGFLIALLISAFTAGLGFVAHELAHKIIAIRHYCLAEFKSNDTMLIIAILMSFAGFIFAAPGYVIIKGSTNKKQNGEISFAGPFSNLILALIFLPGLILTTEIWQYFFYQGFIINSFLGIFNMIPFTPFDGKKIYTWNKPLYFMLTGGLLILVLFGLGLI
ncbi:MAG: metalloprotease [Candidatus Woesearchaeota archaeon]